MGRFKDEMVRTADKDRQCQKDGCVVQRLEGAKFCAAHGGVHAHDRYRKAQRRLYDIDRYNKQISEYTEHDQANTFREEIAVLRMLLQKTLEACKSDADLLLHSQQINQLIGSISNAVNNVTRLEQTLGKLLSEAKAEEFLIALVEIIASHVSDPLTLEAIARECYAAFSQVSSGSERPGLPELHLSEE